MSLSCRVSGDEVSLKDSGGHGQKVSTLEP